MRGRGQRTEVQAESRKPSFGAAKLTLTVPEWEAPPLRHQTVQNHCVLWRSYGAEEPIRLITLDTCDRLAGRGFFEVLPGNFYTIRSLTTAGSICCLLVCRASCLPMSYDVCV